MNKISAAVASIFFTFALILVACSDGDYEYGNLTIKLKAGKKYEITENNQTIESGTWKKNVKEITFIPEDGSPSYTGTIVGKKITINETEYIRSSVGGGAYIYDGAVIDIEYADNL